jgi:hypothetical protein
MPETEPNPEYMTTGQRIGYVILQVLRTIGKGESFFLIVPRTDPACVNNPGGCT